MPITNYIKIKIGQSRGSELKVEPDLKSKLYGSDNYVHVGLLKIRPT